ncbi:MAG: hypothetical protein ACI4PC_06420 [Oscillospiraceae bacterium]
MKRILCLLCLVCLLLSAASCSLRESLLPSPAETPAAPSPGAATPAPSTPSPAPMAAEYEDLGDGTIRCRDYAKSLSFVYPAGMAVLEDALPGAAVVTNGDFLFVVGRNVTEDYAARGLEPAGYIEDYVGGTVLNDVSQLCGPVSAAGEVTVLHEDIEGRSASAELLVTVGDVEVYIKTIMYLSTYNDGTVNYICKSILAPADDTEAFNTLALGVIGMGAARLR